MHMTPAEMPAEVAEAVRRELRALAAEEDRMALEEAAALEYWQPVPIEVEGHRTTAGLLWARAEALEAAA